MNIKRKLISIVTLSLMGSSAFATEAWSTSDLSSYSAGTIVTDQGKTYKCKPWPYEGWCKSAAYRPSGIYGADAWDETGPGPSPTPAEKVTANVSIQGQLPTTADIDFVSPKGTFTVSNGKVTLEYPKDGSETYTVKLKGDEGTISPSTVTVSATTTTIALTYTAKPAPEPTPGIKAWDPSAVYTAGDQVTYNNSIYEAKWWTQGNNPETSGEWGPWKLVGEDPAKEKATLTITIPAKPAFVTDSSLPTVTVFDKNNTKVAEKNVNWNSSVDLKVPAGELKVSVSSIGSSRGTATPNNFSIAKGETKNIAISYEQAQVGSINLIASADRSVSKAVDYVVKDEAGNVASEGTVNFTSPTVIDDLPASTEGVKYTITAKDFTYDGRAYVSEPTEVVVYSFNKSEAQLQFTSEEIPTEAVNITVTDLPKGKETTLKFTSSNGDSQQLKVNASGVYTEQLPKDGNTWTVSADKISGYKDSINPSSFVADQNEQNVNLTFEQVAPIEAGKKVIGYWENWKPGLISGDYKGSAEDVAPYTHVLYSFLTLDSSPNPENPANKKWNSGHINESMAGADVLSVMGNYQNPWDNNYNWQRVRIDSLINLTHANNGKFIWAIGGWSDLQQTISDDQIDAFVNQVIELLKLSGDGVDFDWEHLSQLADGSPNPNKEQQLATLAKTLKTLREKLDAEGMSDKQIGYTTRFNAFFESSKNHGFANNFNSDGEGIAIEKWLKDNGSSLDEVVNWVNIMAYDVSPNDMPNGKTWTKAVYEDMLNSFSKYVNPSLVVLGFEPGGQAASGEWEGLELDKQMIDYVAEKGFGGSMFWAINQPAMGTASTYYQNVITGDNVNSLANYSQDAFAE